MRTEQNPFTDNTFCISLYVGDISIKEINFGYIDLIIITDEPNSILQNEYYFRDSREILDKLIDDEYKSN